MEIWHIASNISCRTAGARAAPSPAKEEERKGERYFKRDSSLAHPLISPFPVDVVVRTIPIPARWLRVDFS